MSRKPTEFEMSFGKRLQKLRKGKGYSQNGLAVATGIPIATIQNWERSKRTPLLDAALKVAQALNISLGELAGWEPHPGQGQQGPHEEDTGRRRRGRGR
jgi:transcriptional regulator with XRE-family HTH domain